MGKNRGKSFEQVVKESFEKVDGVSVVRLHDQTTGYLGSSNHCDFIVYKKPCEYHIECKSVHGNTLPFSNITKTQWDGLLEKSTIPGVHAGIICWWIDKDITRFIPIELLQYLKDKDDKSIRYDCDWNIAIPDIQPFTFRGIRKCIDIDGKKKRVFFDYDMGKFLSEVR